MILKFLSTIEIINLIYYENNNSINHPLSIAFWFY